MIRAVSLEDGGGNAFGYGPGLENLTPRELLELHAQIIKVLRKRGIVRSTNNPLADYTEWLVASKLSLRLESNSNTGFDATDSKGTRYEIKGRRITPQHPSMQLSQIRNLNGNTFDFLIAVIFSEDYEIVHAVQIPHAIIQNHASYNEHVNAHILRIRDSILNDPVVIDLRARLL